MPDATLSHLLLCCRVRTFGVEHAVEGDLVLIKEAGQQGVPGAEEIPGAAEALGEAAAAIPLATDGDEAAEAAELAAASPGGISSSRQRLAAVHVVTRAEARAGRWHMRDVVLPVPGRLVSYPAHATRRVYAEAAARDGITLPGRGLDEEREGGRGPAAVARAPPDTAVLVNGAPVTGERIPPTGIADVVADDAAATTVPLGSASHPADGAVPKAIVEEFNFSSLTGDYRHVVLRPEGFEFKLMRYRQVIAEGGGGGGSLGCARLQRPLPATGHTKVDSGEPPSLQRGEYPDIPRP